MNNEDFLYRGCSVELYNRNKGELIPNINNPFTSALRVGQTHARSGNGTVSGNSTKNEVIKHQFKQLGIPTSGISTTPHIERAFFYATHGKTLDSGYIYKIDKRLLKKYLVKEWIVSELVRYPSIPEDNEVILVANDFSKIPNEVIVSIDLYDMDFINRRVKV